MDSLTMSDRGDCCPAQARVLVGKGKYRLMFCMHHFRKNEDALLTGGWEVIIQDTTGLVEKVGVEVA